MNAAAGDGGVRAGSSGDAPETGAAMAQLPNELLREVKMGATISVVVIAVSAASVMFSPMLLLSVEFLVLMSLLSF